MKYFIACMFVLFVSACATVNEPLEKPVNDRCVTYQHPKYDPTKWVYECVDVDHA